MGPVFGKSLDSRTTAIPGVVLFDLPVLGDNRGWFKENWQREGPAFGAVFTAVLDPSTVIYVPAGVGTAFQTLADATVEIPWPIPLEQAELSQKDRNHPWLADVDFATRTDLDLAGPSPLGGIDVTMVHVSSGYVFDGTIELHDEEEPVSPLGVYGQSKAAGDVAAATTPRHYIVRTSWVVGDGNNFLKTLLAAPPVHSALNLAKIQSTGHLPPPARQRLHEYLDEWTAA
ncbi:sugar nucleotide-binding protein [Arthrobacter sp. LAPM80]